jgi:hypothetical protein
MLSSSSGILGVIPEGVEDVVIIRDTVFELHQVKTRDESQGPWMSTEVLPILCKQYHHRQAFTTQCQFHFASNQVADANRSGGRRTLGILYRLKHLLELLHSEQPLRPKEEEEFARLEQLWIKAIQTKLLDEFSESVSDEDARSLLRNTWVSTDCPFVREPNNPYLLQHALHELFPEQVFVYTPSQIDEIYGRIVLLIVHKIINGKDLEDRTVTPKDILECRVQPHPLPNTLIDWDTLPGNTLLEKKTLYSGFDQTEIPTFKRQMFLAEETRRKIESLGRRQDIDKLTTALLDCQSKSRHDVCREQGIHINPGPHILSVLRPQIPAVASAYFPDSYEVDEQFCIGTLWRETNNCSASWHELPSSTAREQNNESLQS